MVRSNACIFVKVNFVVKLNTSSLRNTSLFVWIERNVRVAFHTTRFAFVRVIMVYDHGVRNVVDTRAIVVDSVCSRAYRLLTSALSRELVPDCDDVRKYRGIDFEGDSGLEL